MIYEGENALRHRAEGKAKKVPRRLLKYLPMWGHSDPRYRGISVEGISDVT